MVSELWPSGDPKYRPHLCTGARPRDGPEHPWSPV